jgi:hypothetical protein
MNRRLGRLELVWRAPRCATCLGRPHRIVTVDMDSDEVISETMPETGCPVCGESVYREYRLVADRRSAVQEAGCIANG